MVSRFFPFYFQDFGVKSQKCLKERKEMQKSYIIKIKKDKSKRKDNSKIKGQQKHEQQLNEIGKYIDFAEIKVI